MSVSRRRFLEIGSLVTASSAIALHGSAADTAQGLLSASLGKASLHEISAKQAEALVGSRFSVAAGLGQPLQLDLASVENLPRPRKDDGAIGEAFVLKFRLVRGTSVPQGTYVFDNEKIGRCPLLIVPSGSKPAHYAAVINHRRPPWA
jgi:hypothetical protein